MLSRADLVTLQIDRLSSLPPELLLTIFDLAYEPNQRLLEPLSKRLLPYFRRNLYRQIRLTSRSSWSKLQRTVKALPQLGELVLDLDTSNVFTILSPGEFSNIVEPFPQLNSVKTGYIYPPQHTAGKHALASLEHISCSSALLRSINLAYLSTYPLRTLEIHFFESIILDGSSAPSFESLEKLILSFSTEDAPISEEAVWSPPFARIVDHFPNLSSLELVDPVYPDFSAFLSNLPRLASRITSLTLESPVLDDDYDISCDHLLPLFSNLTYLSIADGHTSSLFPSYLYTLPYLATLRLGPDAHYPVLATSLIPLFHGSTKLPSLRRLILDCFGGRTGLRMDESSNATPNIGVSMPQDGWIRPISHDWTISEIEKLLSACGQGGIIVEGKGTSTVRIIRDFELEEANRSVLRCLQLKSLDVIQFRDGSPRFSHIPVDGLDPENLKLVKTDLPEKNWFRLSLE